jgi:hypothetical protein
MNPEIKIVKDFLFLGFYQSPRCMPKNRRIIIPFIIIASLIVVILFYFTVHKRISPAEPLKAVPNNAIIIIRVNNFKALYEKTSVNNLLWNELKAIPGIAKLNNQLRFLDSLLQAAPEAENILNNPPSFISAHITGKDRISFLHVLKLPPGYGESSVNSLITSLVGIRADMDNREYEGITIHEIVLKQKTGIDNFLWAASRNILMISFSPIILEDAIRQLNADESVSNLKGFPEIYATAGKNVDANVFINFSRFPLGLASMAATSFRSKARSANDFAEWAGMDVNLLSDMLLMNGFIDPPDSAASLAALFVKQNPQKITADKILPGSIASFLTISMSDPEKYVESYKSYLQALGKLTSYNNTFRTLNDIYTTDLPADFTMMMDNELTLAYDEPSPQDDSAQVYVLLRVKSKGLATDKMMGLLQKAAAYESKSVSDFTINYQLDNEVNYNIYRLPVYNLTANLFGGIFSSLGEHFFVLIDNYLVFGSSAQSLRSLIHNQVLNKTLENDEAFKQFKNSLSPRSNILFYNNLNRSRRVFSPFLRKDLAAGWEKYEAVFQKIPVMGFQMYSNNKMLYSNFLVKYLPVNTQETQTVWESKLDTLAACKPVFVLNQETQQNVVFVQDMRHNIYLINQVGRILWKIQLPELINSEIYQVDYFRNGKKQLLFSTRHSLYLIDRMGNFVGRYPIQLRSPATCGVSVFDYDNTRDYRLFIASEDKKIYAYKKEGTLLDGWSFGQSESEVTQPVNHFRIGDKDFLVFGDRFRTYILDRKGNTRVSTDVFFPRSVLNNYYLDLPRDGSSPGLITTDTTGKVYDIQFDGTVKTIELDGFTAGHYFDYKDLTGDGVMEYIFVDRNRLSVYSHDKSQLFTYKFNEDIDIRPAIYQFSSGDRKLGVVSRKEDRVYLFNGDGKLYDGFPLQGNTPFSIGNFGDSLSRFNLVVGSRDNFLYNYRVH